MKVVLAAVLLTLFSASVLAQSPEPASAASGIAPMTPTSVDEATLADTGAFEVAELGLVVAPTLHCELLVVGISFESPAARAGVRTGDFILKIDGHDIASTKELNPIIRGQGRHEAVKLTMWRGGKARELALPLLAADQRPNPERRPWAGLQCDEVPKKGLVIKAVYPNGPAAIAGLKVGDVIVSADGIAIKSFVDAEKYLRQLKPFAEAKVVVLRGGDPLTVTVKMASLRTTTDGLLLETDAESGERSSAARSSELQVQTLILEEQRREAEQRQRLEQLLQEIRQDVKTLQGEVEQSRKEK